MLSIASRWSLSRRLVNSNGQRLLFQRVFTQRQAPFAGWYPAGDSVSLWRTQTMGKSTSAKQKNAPSAPSNPFDKRPCVTCGRQMTPDANQVAAGNDPQRCSRTCKLFKLGKQSNQAVVSEHFLSVVSKRTHDISDSASLYLQSATAQLKFLAQRHAKNTDTADTEAQGQTQIVDVDTWIELILLDVAAKVSRDSSAKVLPTCGDVEEALRVIVQYETEEERAATAPKHDHETDKEEHDAPRMASKRSLGSVLESRGLRERVRQAARRLFILPRNNWACADVLDDTQSHLAPSIDVLQDGKVVDGLHGVSYAKGTMQIKARKVEM